MDTNYKKIKNKGSPAHACSVPQHHYEVQDYQNKIKTGISDLKSYTCNEGDDGANRFAQRHEQLIYEWYRIRVREFIAKYQIVLLFQATTQIQGLPNILFFPFGSTLPNNDKNLLDHTSELNDDHTNNGDED